MGSSHAKVCMVAALLAVLVGGGNVCAAFYQCGVPAADAGSCPDALSHSAVAAGFCVSVFRSNVTPAGDVLVVERGMNPPQIVLFYDDDCDRQAEGKVTLVSQQGLNHGLTFSKGYIYASSATTVWRWPYQSGSRTAITAAAETVVHSMNADGQGGAPGGHTTRTVAVDDSGMLYVSVGSAGNVDTDSFRSRIRRFDLSALPPGGIAFVAGEVFADGLRNEVGLAFDGSGVLWGVENGADNLNRGDLGGDIHHENPAEELNRFPESKKGQHWGYPYCFSEFKLEESKGRGAGSVWAWPTFMEDGTHDDAWCRTQTNPSIMAMQAHSAPLGITFFNKSKHGFPKKPARATSECTGGFPPEMHGDAFVAFHGSWNRQPPTGYKVVHVAMNKDTGEPCYREPADLMCHAGSQAKWPSGVRPVDVRFDSCNRLLVTDDGAHQVLIITYTGASSTVAGPAGTCSGPAPTPAPVTSTASSFGPALAQSTLATPSPVTSLPPGTLIATTPSAPLGLHPATTQGGRQWIQVLLVCVWSWGVQMAAGVSEAVL